MLFVRDPNSREGSDACSNERGRERQQKNRLCVSSRPFGFWCGDQSGCTVPPNKPNHQHHHAQQIAANREQNVIVHRSCQRQLNYAAEEMPTTVWPEAVICQRIPKDVRRYSDEYRCQNKSNPRSSLQREPARAKFHPLTHTRRQPGPERFLRVSVKDPEDRQSKRQIKRQHTLECVPKASIREKSNVVLEVGSKTTNDKSRKDEPRPAKRQSGSGVNKSEWHCSNYDAFPAQLQRTVESYQDSPAAVWTGFYETLPELGFVTRARLQPGRKRRKTSEGFSPCWFKAQKMIAFGEFRNSLCRPVMFDRDARMLGLSRDMLCLGACLIAGIRLALRGLLPALGR